MNVRSTLVRRCSVLNSTMGRHYGIVVTIIVVLALVVTGNVAHAAKYSSLIMDAANGQVMYGVNADQPRYPASLTKMMTLFLTFEALDAGRLHLSDPVRISPHAAAQAPSKLGLRPGDDITVQDAILALVTKSANDIAVALAEHLGGSERAFAKRMTARAHALGMSNTYFHNASGLPSPGQVTTARDMATLAYALLHRFPRYYAYFSTASFTYGGVSYANHNRLLGRYPGVDGIKTGFINASGFNLVASAKRDGRRLIGVVFGAHSGAERSRMMTALLDSGFDALNSGRFVETALLRNLAKSGHTETAARSEDTTNSWTIRVGPHYRNLAQAERAGRTIARKAPPAVASSRVEIVRVRDGKRKSAFLVQWRGLDHSDAVAACRQVRSHGLSCHTAHGRGGTVVASVSPYRHSAMHTDSIAHKATSRVLVANAATVAKAAREQRPEFRHARTTLASQGKVKRSRVLAHRMAETAGTAKPQVRTSEMLATAKRRPAPRGQDREEALQACRKTASKHVSCKGGAALSDDAG